ncbi:MAG: winged helix-turn-helix transcriptional regulator [Sedimentisphaerales bacterium]|nr:winged helix-turn-helix transcriptional regulator [Sedimentisphaerales bacterium]
MRGVLDISKALADGSRLRILMSLTDGELCVCQIVELLGLAPSTVSKHMYILRQAGLVEGRKEGRWMYYRLADRKAAKPARDALTWVRRNLADTAEIRRDRKKLQRIVCVDREELCKKQNRS